MFRTAVQPLALFPVPDHPGILSIAVKISCAIPVSYTHLTHDSFTLIQFGGLIIGNIIYGALILGKGYIKSSQGLNLKNPETIPVSYTHLDVYKRQLPGRATTV